MSRLGNSVHAVRHEHTQVNPCLALRILATFTSSLRKSLRRLRGKESIVVLR